jgi:hypothetical protein
VAATKLLVDGEGGGQANSDDWFPWLGLDQGTGIAYAGFYSTRDDPIRASTHFYVRSVTAAGDVGALQRASVTASDYSGEQCCQFGNDYGDYTGLDVTTGFIFPVWSGTIGANGEIFMDRLSLTPNQAPSAAITGPATATVGQQVTFSAAGSSDPDGTIASYQWDLDGDGIRETATTVPSASTTYQSTGARTVSVRVADNKGAESASASTSIDVTAPPGVTPTATAGAGSTPTATPATRSRVDPASALAGVALIGLAPILPHLSSAAQARLTEASRG